MKYIYTQGHGSPEIDLYDALRTYARSDVYPFHMPGHKRRIGGMCDPFAIDITEVEGFDDLHHAEGILLEAQRRAAAFYGAKETFYLVNGSTAGVLAAISAAAAADRSRRRILLARNSHRSAYHAAYLNRLEPLYLYPEAPDGTEQAQYAFRMGINGRISPETVEKMLEQYPDVCAVFLTSPTYDGVVSDIAALAGAAHRHGVMLIVDCAHGAHFGIHPALPDNPVTLGADLVVMSLHKTLPSLTQTGLLHLSGDLANPDLVRRFLDIYQTSSPSYVFMAGMDRCIRYMKEEGRALYEALIGYIADVRSETERLSAVRLIWTDDPSRILISAQGRLSGREICDILRERFHIEPEMCAPGYVLCLLGAGDDAEGLDRLKEALLYMDALITGRTGCGEGPDTCLDASKISGRAEKIFTVPRPEYACSLWEAWDAPYREAVLEESSGEVCAEFVMLYPPGIPILTPGERITRDIAEYMRACRSAGLSLNGMADHSNRKIRIL